MSTWDDAEGRDAPSRSRHSRQLTPHLSACHPGAEPTPMQPQSSSTCHADPCRSCARCGVAPPRCAVWLCCRLECCCLLLAALPPVFPPLRSPLPLAHTRNQQQAAAAGTRYTIPTGTHSTATRAGSAHTSSTALAAADVRLCLCVCVCVYTCACASLPSTRSQPPTCRAPPTPAKCRRRSAECSSRQWGRARQIHSTHTPHRCRPRAPAHSSPAPPLLSCVLLCVCVSAVSFPLVLLVTDSSEESGRWDVQRLLDERLLHHPRVTHIHCNPIAPRALHKAVNAHMQSAATTHTYTHMPTHSSTSWYRALLSSPSLLVPPDPPLAVRQ